MGMKAMFLLLAAIGAATVADAATNLQASVVRGVSFLLSKQAADGHWSDPQMPALTALPLWALTGCAGATAGGSAAGATVDVARVNEAMKKAAGFVLATQRPDGNKFVKPVQ